MSNTDLWMFGDDGCLHKFDEGCHLADRNRPCHSKKKIQDITNLHCDYLDLHDKGHIQQGQNDVIKRIEDSKSPTMFRNGFGILSVRPVKKSQRKRESLDSNVKIENLSDVSHENSQPAVTSENIQNIGAVIKMLPEKSITSQQENVKYLDMPITTKNTVSSTDCLVNPTTLTETDDTPDTSNPRKVSPHGSENSLSSKCGDMAFKYDNSCFVDQSMLNVLECEGNLLPKSSLPDNSHAKPSMPEKNGQSCLGLVVSEPQMFVAIPIELQETSISTSSGSDIKNTKSSIEFQATPIPQSTVSGSDKKMETPQQIVVEKSVTSELNNPNNIMHVSDIPKIDSSTSEVSTSVYNQDTSSHQITVSEANRQGTNEIVHQSCGPGESSEVQTTTDEDLPMLMGSNLRRQPIGVSDPKCLSHCDITSVDGLPVTCSQMSLLANEDSLIKYLIDHDNTPSMPEWTETDVGSTSNDQTAVNDTDISLPKVKRTVKGRGCSSLKVQTAVKDTKILKQGSIPKKVKRTCKKSKRHMKKVPMMTTPSLITETGLDCIPSSSQNQSSESMHTIKTVIKTEQSNEADYNHEHPRNQVHIKTEPFSSNDELASAVVGNTCTVRIKSEPVDDAVCTSTESQIKDHLTNPMEFQNHCPQSLSRTTTGTMYLTDGASRKRKHSFGTFTDMATSNEYDVNSVDSQQLHQPHQLPGPLSTAVPTQQNESFLPFKIQSVFSLKSHSHNMSIQDIVNIHEKDTADKLKAFNYSEWKKSKISCPADNSNQKIPNTVILSKEVKSDPRLRSSCYVVINRLRWRNGHIEDPECSQSCKHRFLSENNLNEDASYPPYIPNIRTKTGSGSASVNSSGTRYASSTFLKVPTAPSLNQPKVYVTSTVLPRKTHTQTLTDPSKEAKKYCTINVQGKNLLMPSVKLKTPLNRQKLKVNTFPGMQLPKVSSRHCSNGLKSLSSATDPTHSVLNSSTSIGSKSIVDFEFIASKELNRNMRAFKKITNRRNLLYGIAARNYGMLDS
ncbi:uncharacterized protein LOC117327328 [Pecten maximus]|uniref:uncharacterized protein LOC117327328 n=1 Tax=Pecten maximus TaxID=6579 RepID=UPI0014583514|nr:uncharacterized protein LOC117327328 [Pecten maximus]